MARDKGNPTPPLYIELMDGESDKITIPASTIFDIHLRVNQTVSPNNTHSRVVVVRLNPDNSRSSIIAMFPDKNPYHQSAATSYYERLTALIGAIRLNTWNKSDKPAPEMI